jgi:hypothetical protein
MSPDKVTQDRLAQVALIEEELNGITRWNTLPAAVRTVLQTLSRSPLGALPQTDEAKELVEDARDFIADIRRAISNASKASAMVEPYQKQIDQHWREPDPMGIGEHSTKQLRITQTHITGTMQRVQDDWDRLNDTMQKIRELASNSGKRTTKSE